MTAVPAATAAAGPVVLVTGAGGGIGTAICGAFADAGWRVAGHVRSSQPPAGLALELQGDLAQADAAAAAVAAVVQHLGRLDAVVCGAAAQDLAGFLDDDDDRWRRMLEINLLAAHRVVRAAAPALAEAGGSVIHIASIEARDPAVDHAAYAVSKAALVQHARAAALELGPAGIRVNSVSPGLVHRPGIEGAWPDGVARWTSAAPLGRLVRPEEVAAACAFLASPAASGISGADLPVDVGMGARPRW